MDMNEKKFVFLMATPDLRVEWSGNESAEWLITKRFPPTNSMHNKVKRFCETAKAGDFLQTAYNFIFCCDDGVKDIFVGVDIAASQISSRELAKELSEDLESFIEKASREVDSWSDDKKAELGDIPIPNHKPKVYIAGKITGLEYDKAFGNFAYAEAHLIEQGYETLNPMRLVDQTEGKTWAEYMCDDMLHLFECEAIYLLSDWFDSKGARIEFAIAKELGLKILFQAHDWAENNNDWHSEFARIEDATMDLWQNNIHESDSTQTILDAIERLRAERNQYAEENKKLRGVIASRGKLI